MSMNEHKSNGKVQIVLALYTLLATVLTCCSTSTGADVVGGTKNQAQTLELASPFLDNAVLQRDMPVPVWGWAKPGSIVSLTFAGQKKTAKANARGEWEVKLVPLKASIEGRDLSVIAFDGESLTLKDILVGEVWFASGQSNMDWAAGKSMCRDLAYPNTDACKEAAVKYIETIKQYNRDVAALLKAGKELPDEMASKPPSFPQPYYNQWSNYTETATHTYNFCISPITPYAVRGVVWIPSQKNIGEDVSRYEPALNAYANSLAQTYGQDKVAFIYAQPTAELVEGIKKSQIKNSVSVEFDAWPRSLKDIAARLGAWAAEK